MFELLEGEPASILAQLAGVLPDASSLIELQLRSSVMLDEHFEVVAHRTAGSVAIEAMLFQHGVLVSVAELRQIENLLNGAGELQQQNRWTFS